MSAKIIDLVVDAGGDARLPGIDLSVGSVLALSSAVFAAMFADYGLPWPLAALVGLLVGGGVEITVPGSIMSPSKTV